MNRNSRSTIVVFIIAVMTASAGCTSKRTESCNVGHAKYVENKKDLDKEDAEKALSACEGSCFSAKEADACTKYTALHKVVHPGVTPRKPPK